MPNGDIYEIIYKNDEDVKLLEKSIVNNNNDYFMKNTSLLKSKELEKFRGTDMRYFFNNNINSNTLKTRFEHSR